MDLKCLIPVIQLGYNLMMEEDDEEEELYYNEIGKVQDLAESIVPKFDNRQFREHFRLTPDVFNDLINKLHTLSCIGSKRGHPEISIDKQVMMTLWYLGNMECFRSVASRFGVAKSTCWDIIGRICLKLLEVNGRYKIICWPTRGKALENIEKFRNANGFPGVIGAIDGCHIRILPPKQFPNSYYNRKKFCSVLLQGVCNRDKLFIDVYAGEPGSIHDANLFNKSDLHERIDDLEFPNDSHLVGDLAYPLSKKLLVGFKDLGNLDQNKKYFNWKLSAIRVCIEHAFALLKGRFRRLKYLETRRLNIISLLIIASCILHNLCILKGHIPDELDDEDLEDISNDEFMGEENQRTRSRREGECKREQIANLLYANRDN